MKQFLKPKIENYIKDLTTDCYEDYMLLLNKVCERLNLKIFESDFDDDNVSGLLTKDEDSDTYSIYVNRTHPTTRKRFTIAHEIGHYVSFLKGSYSEAELKENQQVADYSVVWRHKNINSPAEIEANLIAAEILMPKTKVEELIKSNNTPEEMAGLFYVSVSAMTYRVLRIYPNYMVI